MATHRWLSAPSSTIRRIVSSLRFNCQLGQYNGASFRFCLVSIPRTTWDFRCDDPVLDSQGNPIQLLITKHCSSPYTPGACSHTFAGRWRLYWQAA